MLGNNLRRRLARVFVSGIAILPLSFPAKATVTEIMPGDDPTVMQWLAGFGVDLGKDILAGLIEKWLSGEIGKQIGLSTSFSDTDFTSNGVYTAEFFVAVADGNQDVNPHTSNSNSASFVQSEVNAISSKYADTNAKVGGYVSRGFFVDSGDITPFAVNVHHFSHPGNEFTYAEAFGLIFFDGKFEINQRYKFEIGSDVPELSTWTMALVGFAGLGLAGYRRARTA